MDTTHFKNHIINSIVDTLEDYENQTNFDYIISDEIYTIIYYSRCNEFINNSFSNAFEVIAHASELYNDMTGENLPTENINSEYIVNSILNYYAHEIMNDLENEFEGFDNIKNINNDIIKYLLTYQNGLNKLPF